MIWKKDKLLLYPHSIDWIHQVPIANKAEAESVALDSTEPLRSECQHFWIVFNPGPLREPTGWKGLMC